MGREEEVRRAYEAQHYDLYRLHHGLGNAAVRSSLAFRGDLQAGRDLDDSRSAGLVEALLARDDADHEFSDLTETGPGPSTSAPADEAPAPAPVADNSDAEATETRDSWMPETVTVRDPASGLDISYHLGGGAPDVDLSQVRDRLGSGRPLDPDTRDYMEWRFGLSFDKVRIHTGPKANAISKALFAHAFALGPEVAFAGGTYRPGTREGDHLLAHELTHVVQAGLARPLDRSDSSATASPAAQRRAATSPQRSGSVSEPTDAFELEAERNAAEIVRVGRSEFARWKREQQQLETEEEEETRRPPASELVRRALADSGRPLPEGLRQRLESRFDRDLSQIRIHDGPAAAAAAEALGARAATLGDHVLFADGAFEPGTATGDELIAHEVTHVVQNLEGREPTAGDQQDDVPVTSPDSAVEAEARTEAAAFMREPAEADRESADVSHEVAEQTAPPTLVDAAASVVARDDTEAGEGGLTPVQQAQLDAAEAALQGVPSPEPTEEEDASAAGPTEADEAPEVSADGPGDSLLQPAGEVSTGGGARSLPAEMPAGTPAPAAASGPVALDGLVDHYMATHWDSSDFDAKVQEFGVYPDAIATELDRWLPPSVGSSTRAGANLLVGLGAGLMDSFFQEFAKSIPGFGMIAHLLVGIKDAWSDAAAYSKNGDNVGAVLIAIRHAVSTIGGMASNLGDLATAVQDGAHVLAPFVAGLSEIIGVPAAGIATGCQAVSAFCAGFLAAGDTLLVVYNLVKANEVEAAGNFQRGAFFRGQAQTQAIRAITSVVKAILAATSTMTVGIVPGGVPQNFTQLISSSGQKFMQSFGGLQSGSGRGGETAVNVFDRFAGSGAKGAGAFQGVQNLLAVTGMGDQMQRSRDGFAGGEYIDRQALEGAGSAALSGLRDARAQTIADMDAGADAMDAEKPLWHQDLVNRILNPSDVTFLSALNVVVNPSEWIRLQFAGLRYVLQALGDGGLETVSALAGMAGSALSGIAQPFIDNVNSWITENKPRMDEWVGELSAKIQAQRISLEGLRSAATGAQQFLDTVSGFGNEGGALDSAIQAMIGPLDSFTITAESLGIPDWVPEWLYRRAIAGINSAIDGAAQVAHNLADQVREGIDARLDSLAEWASAQVTTFQEAISEGGEVETLLNDQLAKVQAMVAEAAAAFQAWDGRIPIDLSGAAGWLQSVAANASDATTSARQDRYSEYVRTVGQAYVDQWKGRHGDSVEANWFPEMPTGELDALDAAWTSIQAVLQPIANDTANPYSASATQILADAGAAYGTASAFRSAAPGADSLAGLWAAEEAFVAAAAQPLEPAVEPTEELPPGGLPNEAGGSDAGVQGSSTGPLRGDVSSLADQGTSGAGGSLPYASQIQDSFGKHDISSIRAHTGADARAATSGMGAEAFARGDDVAFSKQPDLHTAAHEAAHVVQQRQGVQLYGGVGTPGDRYERQADAAADAVVAGRSAEPVLSAGSGAQSATHGASSGSRPVQMKVSDAGTAFLNKGLTAQAREWDGLGGDLSTSFSQDEAAAQRTVPVIDEQMGPPSEEPAPAGSEVAPPETNAQEPTLDSTEPSEPDFAEVQEGEAPPMPRIGSVPSEDSGASEQEVRAVFQRALSGTPTEIADMDTSPGPPPAVELDGRSDPAQADDNREQALGDAEAARAEAASAVQAIAPDEEVTYQTVAETHTVDPAEIPQIEGMEHIPEADEIISMGLPEDVQGMADQLTKDQIDASTAEARAKMDQVSADRESEQKKLVDEATAEQSRLSEQANREQQAEVTKARRQISDDQRETERRQRAAVQDANTRSERERSTLQRNVDSEVEAGQRQVDEEFRRAEREAEAKKAEKEREAEEAKREAESKSEDGGGLFGWIGDAISSAFDWLADAIGGILDALASAVTAIIDAAKEAANALIDAARNLVVGLIEAFGEFLQAMVDNLLGAIFPELAAWLNEKIDQAVQLATDAVNWVADRLKEGINALLDGLKAGILAAIEAARAGINFALDLARAALTGDWETFAKKLLEAALALAGIDPSTFDSVMNSGIDTIKSILDDPGSFIGNVIDGVGQGFSQFAGNFLTHLQNGFFEWLAGPLGEGGITLPSSWDLAGIFGLVMQVVGLTQDGIRGVIEEELGETAGVVFDYIWRYVGALIEGGIEGLWEEVQNDLSSLWEMVVDGIKNWVLETIVTQAVLKIASMFSPVGALVQALVTVYNVYTFLRDNISRIWGVVQTVVEMLSNLANGIIQPAADGVENALAGLVPVAISLLANLIGLGGIGAKVKEVIEGIQGTVHGAIRSLIRRVRGMFQGGGQEGEEGEEVEQVQFDEVPFSADTAPGAGEEAHRLFFDTSSDTPLLKVASANPSPIATATTQGGEFEKVDGSNETQVNQLAAQADDLATQAWRAEDAGTKQDLKGQSQAKMEQVRAILANYTGERTLQAMSEAIGGSALVKYQQLQAGEGGVGGLVAGFEEKCDELLAANEQMTPLEAMQQAILTGDYLCKGPEISPAEMGEVKRALDLPSVWNYYPEANKTAWKSAGQMANAHREGLVDIGAGVAGRLMGTRGIDEAWFFEGGALDLPAGASGRKLVSELERQLHIDNPAYDMGSVILTWTAANLLPGVRLHKPTVFDGISQGDHADSWWIWNPSNKWGVTKGGIPEAVASGMTADSAGDREVIIGRTPGASEPWETELRAMEPGASAYATDQIDDNAQETVRLAQWADVKSWLLERDSFHEPLNEGHRVGRANIVPTKAGAKEALESIADEEQVEPDNIGDTVNDVVGRSKPKVHSGQGNYGPLKDALLEHSFTKADPTRAARTAYDYDASPDTRFVLAEIPANDEELISDYDSTVLPLVEEGLIEGNAEGLRNQFQGAIKAKRWQFAAGFRTQMQQILVAARNASSGRFPRLAGVEVRLGGRRHCDYTTYANATAMDQKLQTIHEVKNWTSFEQEWETQRDRALIRLAGMETQAQAYLHERRFLGVVVEWTGTPPRVISTVFGRLERYAAALSKVFSVTIL